MDESESFVDRETSSDHETETREKEQSSKSSSVMVIGRDIGEVTRSRAKRASDLVPSEEGASGSSIAISLTRIYGRVMTVNARSRSV